MYKERRRTNIVIGWVVILLGILVFSVLPTFAIQKDTSKQWKLLNTNNVADYLSSITKSALKYDDTKYDLSTHKFSTDLFWDNASKHNVKKWWKLIKWLDGVKWVLQAVYPSCELKDSEILGILFYTNWNLDIKNEVMKSTPKSRWPKVSDQKAGCQKLTQCIAWKSDWNMNWSCDEIVKNAYVIWANEQAKKYMMEESNLWNEKYYNWTLDDSNYDILYDMQQITKTLYDDPQTVTSVLFYANPNYYFNKKNNNQNQQGGWSNTPWTSWTPWNGNQGQTQQPGQQNDTPGGQWGQGNPNNPQWQQGGWDNPSVTEDDEINDFISEDEEKKVVTSQWNPAYINKCVTIKSDVVDEAYLEAVEEIEESIEEWRDPTTVTPEELDAILDEILDSEANLQIVPNKPLVEQQKKQGDVPWTKWASADPTEINQLRDQLLKCVDKCDGLRVDEKAVCRAKCLCAEYSSKAMPDDEEATYRFLEEWALRIRICTIPSKTKIISTTTRNVNTIEAIIVMIHDAIKALYESWELTPKVKKQEMLDSSLNETKLSFMIALWMKFEKPTKEDRDLLPIEWIKKDLDDQVLWMDPTKNPNFFNVLSDNSPSWNWAPVAGFRKDNQVAIKENQLAWIYSAVYDFLEKNYQFLDSVDTAFKNMTDTLNGIPYGR